ncbi:hypothetical protein LCGC14_3106390, partial [marine sediment metagenome]
KVDLMNDIFGVAFKFGSKDTVPPSPGTNADPNRNTDQFAVNAANLVPTPDYHTGYDVGGSYGNGNAWNQKPADGTIDLMNDIFGVAFQFSHDCTAAPN